LIETIILTRIKLTGRRGDAAGTGLSLAREAAIFGTREFQIKASFSSD
jgi:hypothetical protein